MKNKKSPLDNLDLKDYRHYSDRNTLKESYEKVFDNFMKVLESRKRILQVKYLEFKVLEKQHLLKILHHIDLKLLKHLRVRSCLNDDELHDDTEMQIIPLLKDCVNLKTLVVYYFTISLALSLLNHIPGLIIIKKTIQCEDMLSFKETFSNSEIAICSIIHYKEFPDILRFKEALGEPQDKNQWILATSGKLMLVDEPNAKCLHFCRNDSYCAHNSY